MKEERIKYLVSRYYQGISTEGEEAELRQFFLKESIPGYEAERELFVLYNDLSVVPEPSKDFEERIVRKIDENSIKQISEKIGSNIWTKAMWVNIAAMVLAIIGTYIFLTNYNKPFDTYDDPHVAYVESVKIYNEVSGKLNLGISALEKIPKVNNVAVECIGQVDHSVSGILNTLNIVDIGKNSNSITLENK